MFARDWFGSSENNDTNVSPAPPCELGHVLGDVCRRILYLRQHHGAVVELMSPLRHRVSLAMSSGIFVDGSYTSASTMAWSWICSYNLGVVAAPNIGTL